MLSRFAFCVHDPLTGITTVVGVAGVDTLSRTLDTLLMKCKALEAEGISAFMWTGAGGSSGRSICGSIVRDMCLVDKILGVGEIEASGFFCARPSAAQLEAMARQVLHILCPAC